jgi:hypothetical protein
METEAEKDIQSMETHVKGRPSVSPPPTWIVRKNRTRTYIPDNRLQEVTFENEAIERWLDDGGTEARRRAASKQIR